MKTIIRLFVESTVEVWNLFNSEKTIWYRHSLLAAAIVGFAAILGGALLGYEATAKTRSRTFEQKMARLKETQAALQELNQFLDNQRQELDESQNAINSLRREHETLRPMVESDRATVNEILTAYAQGQSRSVWKERLIGFGLGILASIIATIICAISVRSVGKRRDLIYQQRIGVPPV